MKKFTLALCAVLAFAAHAQENAPAQTVDGVLVGADGKTLYVFAKDEAGSGKSTCYDECALNWPPLVAAADAAASGDYTIIERSDGVRQWAYKGAPLYYFAKDEMAGDKKGDGVKDVWKVATP